MRLMLVCRSAIKLPANMVSTLSPPRIGTHSSALGAKAINSTRAMTAKPAAFDAVEVIPSSIPGGPDTYSGSLPGWIFVAMLVATPPGKTTVTATTLEGDRIIGEIAWVSRYEFALRVKEKEVVVFRHALDLLEEAQKSPKHPN